MTARLVDFAAMLDRERDIAYREHLRDEHILASAGTCSDAHPDLAVNGSDVCETCVFVTRSTPEGLRVWRVA